MPDWATHIRPQLAELRLSPSRELDIVEELSLHLEERWRELVAGGASPDDASRLALADLDGHALARAMAPLRQARELEPVTPGAPPHALAGDLWRDTRRALRVLRQRPGYAATVILTLALAIGATSAIFAVVDGTLLRALPF